MNYNLIETKATLDKLGKEYEDTLNVLYEEYITTIKDTVTTFSIEDEESKALYEDINISKYLGDIQKALLINIFFHLIDATDHKTMSVVLKDFVKIANRTIDLGEDDKFVVRGLFESIYNSIISVISAQPDAHFVNKIFSYSNGIKMEDITNLVERYALSVQSIWTGSLAYLHFKNGETYLNTNGAFGTCVYIFLEREFEKTSEDSIELKVRNENFKFKFFRDSFDIDVVYPDDNTLNTKRYTFTLDYVKNCKFEDMQSALDKIEDIKEAIEVGFFTKKYNVQLAQAFTMFVREVYKDFTGTTESVRKDAEHIKSYMVETIGK